MKKFHIWQSKGFTLIELIITITIISISFVWLAFFVDVIWTWYKNINLRSITLDQIDLYEEKFADIKNNYTKEIFNDWNILFNQTKWFSLVCLSNEDKTEWVLLWVYDNTNKKVISWDIDIYSKYNPFLLYLTSSDINSIESDKNTFIDNIDFSKLIYFDKINIFKFWYNNISGTNLSKIDFIFSYIFYTDFISMKIIDVEQYDFFKTLKLSIIK